MADNELLGFDGSMLPFSLEAEQAVLGSLLIDSNCIMNVADILSPNNFYVPQHISIYTVILEMYSNSRPIDAITVLEELKEQGVYDDAGGKKYLYELAQSVPTTANVESYAKIIKDKYYIRSLILAARKIINDASAENVNAGELLDSAEQSIYEIRQNRQTNGLVSLSEVLTGETMIRVGKLANPETRKEFEGLPTGFSDIDKITTGLHRSNLIILGARPGMGKTAMALNIALNVASNKSKPYVCIFALEMTSDELASRLVSTQGLIESTKLRTGELDKSEWKRFSEACDVLSHTNIFIDATPQLTVSEIKARLRRMKQVDLVIVDHIGLMKPMKNYKGNRVLEIQEISNNLKIMAKSLNVPVIACCQLNRGTEVKGKAHRPALADLRDSGAIEQDADLVWLLYREDYYRSDAKNPEELDVTKAECIIAKNRHGSTGTAKLHWDGDYTRFTTPAFDRDDEDGN